MVIAITQRRRFEGRGGPDGEEEAEEEGVQEASEAEAKGDAGYLCCDDSEQAMRELEDIIEQMYYLETTFEETQEIVIQAL